MRAAILILALLCVPLVIAVTVAAMAYSMRDKATRPRGVREFAIIGGLVAAATLLIPLLIFLRAS